MEKCIMEPRDYCHLISTIAKFNISVWNTYFRFGRFSCGGKTKWDVLKYSLFSFTNLFIFVILKKQL
jgi:hypothetical protein